MKVVRLYLLCTLLAFFNVQYSMSRPMGDVDTDTIDKSKIKFENINLEAAFEQLLV